MAQVTEIHRFRGTAEHTTARTAELRERLEGELMQLTAELTAPASGEEAAGRGRSAEDREARGRLRLVSQLISGLETADPETIWDDRAGFGSTVFVRDLDSGEETSFTLMVGDLIDIDANQVSLGSPLGQALLGCRAGDAPVVATPHGKRRFRVLALHTLPQRLGIGGPSAPDAA